MLVDADIVPIKTIANVIYVKHMVVTMLVLQTNLLVLKLIVNLYVL